MAKPAQLRLLELTEKDERRFWSKVALPNGEGCMLWMGHQDFGGYGQFKLANQQRRAHRVSYWLAYGPVPDGLVLDHLCRVRHCVTPGHLEPVTSRENTVRGNTGTATAARQRSKTHCPQGHPYDEANTYITPAGNRQCRTCRRVHDRNYRERRAA